MKQVDHIEAKNPAKENFFLYERTLHYGSECGSNGHYFALSVIT